VAPFENVADLISRFSLNVLVQTCRCFPIPSDLLPNTSQIEKENKLDYTPNEKNVPVSRK